MNQDTDTFNQWKEKLPPDSPLFRLRDWHLEMFINFPWFSYKENTKRIMESIDLLMKCKHSNDNPITELWSRGINARNFVSEDMSILMLGSMVYPLIGYTHERVTLYHALVSLGETSPRYRYSFSEDSDMTEEQGQRTINIHELEHLVATKFHGGKEVAIGLEVWRQYLKEQNQSISQLRESILVLTFGEGFMSEASEAVVRKPRAIGDKTMHRYECWYRECLELQQMAADRGEKLHDSAAHKLIAARAKLDVTTIRDGIKQYIRKKIKKV